jgi:hypothetical protein
MGRVSKKFLSSSVTKKKSVTSDTFLIDEETSEGGSLISVLFLYCMVTSSSFLNFIRTSTSCFVSAHTGIAKLGCLKKIER